MQVNSSGSFQQHPLRGPQGQTQSQEDTVTPSAPPLCREAAVGSQEQALASKSGVGTQDCPLSTV